MLRTGLTEVYRTRTHHIDGVSVGEHGETALATSSLTGDVWDGSIIVLRPDAEPTAFSTMAGTAAVAWFGENALAAGDDEGTLSIWQPNELGAADGATPEPILELNEHGGGIHGVAAARGSLRVATASSDATARVWTAVQGSSSSHTLDHVASAAWCDCPVHGVAWLSAEELVTAAGDGVARVWDLRRSRPLVGATPAVDAPLLSLAVAPDRLRFLVGCEAGRVTLSDTRRLAEPAAAASVHAAAVSALSVGPCGGKESSPLLASASEDGSVALLDPHDLHVLLSVEGHDDYARCAAWAPPGADGLPRLLTGGHDMRLLAHTFGAAA